MRIFISELLEGEKYYNIVVVNCFSKHKVDYSGLQDHNFFNLTADQVLFFYYSAGSCQVNLLL